MDDEKTNEDTGEMKMENIGDNVYKYWELEEYWKEGVGGLQGQHQDNE